MQQYERLTLKMLTATHLISKVIAIFAQTEELLPVDHDCGAKQPSGGFGGIRTESSCKSA